MIQWGIIGCGDVTEVKSGPAFNKAEGSRLVAVMRRQEEKAKDYAMRHQVPKWYSESDKLINDPEVNAIYIATPPAYHEEYALAAIEAGKPVYLEKPMTITAASAKNITAAANKKNIKLSVAHYRRQQEKFLFIKQLLKEKVIGEIKSVVMNFSSMRDTSMIAKTEIPWRLDPSISGGGYFHDLSPHQLDLMLYYFGAPVHVSGTSVNLNHHYEVDDTVTCEIHFANGIELFGSWFFETENNIDICFIHGSEGVISFSIFSRQPVSVIREGESKSYEFDMPIHVQQPMIQKVVEYFSGKGPNPCPGEDGVVVMEMIDAISKTASRF